MPSDTIPTYAWDTSTLIAWLKEERWRVNLCEDLIKKVDNGFARLLFSEIVLTEIDVSRMSEDSRKKYETIFQRPSVQIIFANPLIRRLATSFAKSRHLKSDDAIHVVTAGVYHVQEFHTFDRKLLRHNGQLWCSAVEEEDPPLIICYPGVTAWHSTKKGEKVYHNNPECVAGANIEEVYRAIGTAGRRLCTHCSKLNKFR